MPKTADRELASMFGARFREATAGIGNMSIWAELNGFSRSTVNNWLTGRGVPSGSNLARICRALGVSADRLLGLDGR